MSGPPMMDGVLQDEAPAICEPGGGGLIFPIFTGENDWPHGPRAVMYGLELGWLFLGVAILADIFMASIDTITSEKRKIHMMVAGKSQPFWVQVWNPTVANLTLMALGSSAPEILLSIIELFGDNMYTGQLGPSTIVGSAAFNLLMIIAICIVAIPDPDTRRIEAYSVYVCTVIASLFAYVWILLILVVFSPDIIEPWEGVLTFTFMPLLVWVAYLLDIGYFDKSSQGKHKLRNKVYYDSDGGLGAHPELLAGLVADIKAEHGDYLPNDEMARHVQMELSKLQRKSRAYYRRQATRSLTASKPVERVGVGSPPAAAPAQADKPPPGAAAGSKAKLLFSRALAKSRGYGALVDEMGSLENGDALTPRILTRRTSAAVARSSYAVVEFSTKAYCVVESAGSVTLEVTRTGNLNCKVVVAYATHSGTATAGEDFVAVKSDLIFGYGETKKEIVISIIDDDAYEGDETFSVRLERARSDFYASPCCLGDNSEATVLIIDDDLPGQLRFRSAELKVSESDGGVLIEVERHGGTTGAVGCSFTTADASAKAGDDYTAIQGTMHFAEGEALKQLWVAIANHSEFHKDRTFLLKLASPTGGAAFGVSDDGAIDELSCEVTIGSDPSLQAAVHSVSDYLTQLQKQASTREMQSTIGDYLQQFRDAVDPHGGAAPEDAVGAPDGCALLLHFLSLPWKLCFAVIPPTSSCNGKLCFIVSLSFIGIVTAVIGDVAGLFGCVVGLPDSITAITFVALGTSLPDTFASKTAAQQDSSADAAIVNVTGSNAVNVFLGLGLPWLVGSFYWAILGPTPEWRERYPQLAKRYPGGGFAVPAGDLAFSVSVFLACALVCIGVLSYRRARVGAELGGPKGLANAHFLLMLSLWVCYIGASCWKTMAGGG